MGSYRGRFRVPFAVGRCFRSLMRDPPLPPLVCSGWFSWNCLGFWLGSDADGVVLRFLLSFGLRFMGGLCDPPPSFLKRCFWSSFLWMGSWIRLAGIFFRRKLYFFILFICWRYLREVDRGGVVFRFLFAWTPDAVAVVDVVTNLEDSCLWCCARAPANAFSRLRWIGIASRLLWAYANFSTWERYGYFLITRILLEVICTKIFSSPLPKENWYPRRMCGGVTPPINTFFHKTRSTQEGSDSLCRMWTLIYITMCSYPRVWFHSFNTHKAFYII